MLVAGIFLLRGIFLLSVLPPFEGWDEYQHLAYIVHLRERGTEPVLARDGVPDSLVRVLVEYPHPQHSVDSAPGIGLLPYDAYWRRDAPPPPPPEGSRIALYEAQQPSLYYRLAAPLYAASGGLADVPATIGVLRLANLLLGAIVVLLVARVLPGLFLDPRHGRIAVLLVAFNPTFLLDFARVANDPVAVLLGTMAIVLLLLDRPRSQPVQAALAGGLIGLGAFGKLFILALLPFAALVLAGRALRGRRPILRLAIVWGALLAAYVAAGLHHHLANLRTYGSPIAIVEELRSRSSLADPAAYVRALLDIDWIGVVGGRWVKTLLWAGGWSELELPWAFPALFGSMLVAGALGWAAWAIRRPRRPSAELRDGPTALRLFLLCGFMAAALVHHMVNCQLYHGHAITPIWYGAVVFPWGFALVFSGWGKLPPSALAARLGGLFVCVQIAAEVFGTLFVLAPHVTASGAPRTVLARLATLHPVFLSPLVGGAAFLGAALLLVALVGQLRAAPPGPAASRGQASPPPSGVCPKE